MSKHSVVVPDIGGADGADVVEVLVAVGDEVSVDQGLVVLESDKASMEVPATVAGTIIELPVAEGAAVAEGGVIAVIEAASDAPAESPAPASPAAVPEPAAAPDSAALVTVPVPDLGGEDGVDLVEVTVGVGDAVEVGDTLAVLESDKASVEVPAPVAGVVQAFHAAEGARVQEGDPLAEIAATAAPGETPAAEPPRETPRAVDAPAPAESPAVAPPPASTAPTTGGDAPAAAATYAGPAVRKLAREFGIPLERVRGSGPRGRVVKEDLHRYAQEALRSDAPAAGAAALPDVPEVDFAQFGPVESLERSRIDRVTADNMRRSWLNVPHVTQFDDVDITELEAFRKSLRDEGERRGTKMTLLPFLLKACAVALRRHERLNAALSDGGQRLVLKRYVHIGMAVDTPAGLMVPVLRDVDQKSLWDLAAEVIELATSARNRSLRPAQMQGASFTISSLGAVGGRGFTPIVNTPEVAILGVGRTTMAPVWDGSSFQPRLQLPLALSYDHRVVNGGDGGRFLTELGALLADLRRLLL